MKKEEKNTNPEASGEEGTKNRPITRKQAIRKAGYIGLSAATMMLLLSKPDKAVASSPATPP